MSTRQSAGQGFIAGTVIGTLGGLIGLGGAEFRLPVLVGIFRLSTLEAIILNKALSLIVVLAALVFREGLNRFDQLLPHTNIVLNLLAGSLIGAWWAAGLVINMSHAWLNRFVMLLLVGLAVLLLSESWLGLHNITHSIIDQPWLRIGLGLVAGFAIGVVAALLGVAGGEMLIPTIVLLYGVDIRLAGSLSLAISLPTMIVSFSRYTQSNAFQILYRERKLFNWMAIGSILGAMIGGLLLGLVSAQWLTSLLSVILLISAVKTFQHAKE